MREFKGDWRDLFFGFRIALDLRKIFLSFVGSIFSLVGIFVLLGLGAAIQYGGDFSDTLRALEIGDAVAMARNWGNATYVAPVKRYVTDPGSLPGLLVPRTTRDWTRAGPAPTARAPRAAVRSDPSELPEAPGWSVCIVPELILLAMVLWLIFVWSKFGGAITRIAAVEIARDERITTNEALEYSKKKYTSYFWSPISVLIAFFFFYLVNALGGLIGMIPYVGPVLVGILSIFAFLSGFVALLIAIGGFFGWPLMSPAVSAEGTDAFDAVSRAFSYVYSKPWQYAFYWVVSGLYGVASVGFVWIFTLAMIYVTFSSTQVGMGSALDQPVKAIFAMGERPFEDMGVHVIILTVILATIVVLLLGLGASYAVSFFYTARTLMYFILRKRVDNTEMNEVYLEEEEEDLFSQDAPDKAGEGEKAQDKKDCGDSTAPKTDAERPAEGAAPADRPGASEPPKP